MNDNKHTPAFPVTVSYENGKPVGFQNGESTGQEIGLSKREMIAAMALQGLMSCNDKGEFNSIQDSCAEAARIAVIAADALLNELSKS